MDDRLLDEKALKTAVVGMAWMHPQTNEFVRARAIVTAYLAALPPVVLPSREAVEAAIDAAIEAGAAIVVEVFADDERFKVLDEARTVTRAALLALIPTEN